MKVFHVFLDCLVLQSVYILCAMQSKKTQLRVAAEKLRKLKLRNSRFCSQTLPAVFNSTVEDLRAEFDSGADKYNSILDKTRSPAYSPKKLNHTLSSLAKLDEATSQPSPSRRERREILWKSVTPETREAWKVQATTTHDPFMSVFRYLKHNVFPVCFAVQSQRHWLITTARWCTKRFYNLHLLCVLNARLKLNSKALYLVKQKKHASKVFYLGHVSNPVLIRATCTRIIITTRRNGQSAQPNSKIISQHFAKI